MYKRRLTALFLLLFLLGTPLSISGSEKKIITINTQESFSKIPSYVAQAAIEGYSNIEVVVQKGNYFFSEGSFTFKDFNYPAVNVRIIGQNVIIKPRGKDYWNGDVFSDSISPDIVFIANDNTILDLYSEMNQTQELIEVLNDKDGLCRIKINEKKEQSHDGIYITIPQWYKAHTYKVKEIKEGYLYFVAGDLVKDIWGRYSVNYDYILHKDYPRYRLFNEDTGQLAIINQRIKLTPKYNNIHSCDNCSFLRVWNSRFNSFSLSGFSFVGNCYNGSLNALIDFSESYAEVFEVSNCMFYGLKSQLMLIKNTY